MNKLFLIFSFIIFPLIAVSQNSEIRYSNQLKFSAIRPINGFNPGVEFSYERSINNKFSTSVSMGIATNVIVTPFTNLRGYNIGLETKYFLSEKIKRGKYFSMAFNYSDIKYQETTYGEDIITNMRIIDSFTIARKTTSLSFKYGIQYYKKHFLLDINLGAGLKYRNVKHYDRIFEYKGPREFSDLREAANVEGAWFAFYLPIDIQLGYRF